jgi:hypothetical protein
MNDLGGKRLPEVNAAGRLRYMAGGCVAEG